LSEFVVFSGEEDAVALASESSPFEVPDAVSDAASDVFSGALASVAEAASVV
jgi:hypothetical protein